MQGLEHIHRHNVGGQRPMGCNAPRYPRLKLFKLPTVVETSSMFIPRSEHNLHVAWRTWVARFNIDRVSHWWYHLYCGCNRAPSSLLPLRSNFAKPLRIPSCDGIDPAPIKQKKSPVRVLRK